MTKVGDQLHNPLGIFSASVANLVVHSESSECSMSPTIPPTSVPLIRIY
jgi:hypothetical protein